MKKNDILEEIKKLEFLDEPIFWLKFVACGLAAIYIYNLFHFIIVFNRFAALRQSLIFNIPFTSSSLWREFTLEAQRSLGIQKRGIFLLVIYFNIVATFLYIILSIFLFLRKSFARELLLILVIINIYIGTIGNIHSKNFTLTFRTIFDYSLLLFLLIFFMWKPVVKLFEDKQSY